jgi:hypothetical protein
MIISGEFTVQLQPAQYAHPGEDGMQLGRMLLDKTFAGDLSATSRGEMLSVRTPVKGSAGYVALEQVSGQLLGKQGNFVLMHFGTMNRGQDRLVLEVVPDSGSGELLGLSGTMSIKIQDGKHFYEFDWQLPD